MTPSSVCVASTMRIVLTGRFFPADITGTCPPSSPSPTPLTLTTPRPRRRRRHLDLRRSQPRRHLRLHPLSHPPRPASYAQTEAKPSRLLGCAQSVAPASSVWRRQWISPHERTLGAGCDVRDDHLWGLVCGLSGVGEGARGRFADKGD